MLDPHAAEYERHAVLERVRVEPSADPVVGLASAAGSCASDSICTSASLASCSTPHGPRRMCTATMPARFAGSTSLSTRSPT
jgi:hypothetical protein